MVTLQSLIGIAIIDGNQILGLEEIVLGHNSRLNSLRCTSLNATCIHVDR